MFKAFVPSITLPAGKESRRAGGGIGIICNGQTMLFDGFEGGEPTNGMKAWLAENDVSTVDVAVLSHIHYDHYNGLLQIEDDSRFHIKQVLMYDPLTLKHGCDGSANGRAVKDDMNNAYKFIRAMQAHGTKVNWLDKGGVVKCGDTSWKVYRNQPRKFTDFDDGNAYAFVNDGSLVLYSPEVQLLFGGDGCIDLKDAIAYFKAAIIAMYVQHHGNDCPESSARAAANAGVILMWETNVERNGAGTTGFTMYGSRRVVQAGIPVWMQNEPIYITAANGKIVFKQGGKIVTASVPYQSYQTGWNKDAKGWFYVLSDGRRAKGWIKVGWSKPQSKDGKDWFFMDKDGYMVRGLHKCSWSGGIDTFYFDENGVMQYGWKYINGKWYFFDKNGAMKTGWLYDNGSWYYLGADGKMVTGWVTYKGRKCYLEPKSDKNHVQGTCYVNRTAVIDGKTYRFDKDGYATEEKGGGTSINRSKKIIDISEFQGDVNWAKASSEVGAVYIRCGLRGSLKNTAPADYKKIRYDRKWARNLSAVQTYGIPFSAYYFPTAITDAEALEGAKWFYEQVKDLNLAFPPALDSENVWGNGKEAGRANGLSKSERTRLLKIVTDYFNSRGMNIGIYASASWLNSKIDMSAFPQCVIDCTWVADSTGAVDYKGYYWLHQYGKGACAGFSDDIDLNRITGTIPPARIIAAPAVQQKTESPIDVAIQIAESYLGYHEGANNKTIFGDTMHAIQPRNMDANAAWCDAFVDFVILKTCEHFGKGAETARMVLCGDFDDYTYNSVALYKKAGRWFKTPVRGDQIFFGGSGHTGIVTAVNGGTVHTVEGNKGDEVRRGSYSVNSPSIIGYGRPRYDLITGKITAADMPLVKKGSKGEVVKKLQQILNDKGYKLTVDGDFGEKTDAAVRAYQKANHLTVDGEVGEKTWASLL